MTKRVPILFLMLAAAAGAQTYTWQQQGAKMLDGTAYGYFGQASALSADGNTAMVGGPGFSSQTGRTWVLIRTAGVWSMQAGPMSYTTSVASQSQGSSVALSADGNTALVGGPMYGSGAGNVFVWTRSGTTWSQQASLTCTTGCDGHNTKFGTSVSLSNDGNTAIIGGPYDNSQVGGAWVWTRSGSTWTQQAKLLGTGASSQAYQGTSVSISGDGNTAVVGANGNNSYVGCFWAWTRSGVSWTQKAGPLVASDYSTQPYQGSSISISNDGGTVAVGGRNDNSGAGAVWIWKLTAGTWAQQGTKLVGSGGDSASYQGLSVSLSSDGNSLEVGGNGDASNQGAVWFWTRSGVTWAQKGSKFVGTGAVGGQSRQGTSVAISQDGKTAMEGGWYDGSTAAIGAVWFLNSTLAAASNTRRVILVN